MVAFSGVAMANTVDAKEENRKIGFVLLANSCEDFAMDFLDEWDSNNEASPVAAYKA